MKAGATLIWIASSPLLMLPLLLLLLLVQEVCFPLLLPLLSASDYL
jgi:hypothetical protein